MPIPQAGSAKKSGSVAGSGSVTIGVLAKGTAAGIWGEAGGVLAGDIVPRSTTETCTSAVASLGVIDSRSTHSGSISIRTVYASPLAFQPRPPP